jgi:hypothetical protein
VRIHNAAQKILIGCGLFEVLCHLELLNSNHLWSDLFKLSKMVTIFMTQLNSAVCELHYYVGVVFSFLEVHCCLESEEDLLFENLHFIV